MRHVSRTHRVALTGRLTELILIPRFKSSMSTPNINLQTHWHKGTSHVMSGTIFFVCLTSAISAYFAGLRIPAWPAALKRWRKGCKNKRVKRGSLQSQNRRWIWSRMLRQVLPLCRIRLRRKARGYSRHFVKKWLDKYKETSSKRIQSRRSIEFSRLAKDAVLDVSTRRLVATEEEDQEHLNFHEDSKNTRRLVASGNSETGSKDKIWPRNLQFIYRLRAAHGEGFLNCETKILSQSER